MPRHTRATRQRILESAYRLFYREGFQRSGVDAVAEATGVTKRTLYNHFPSKDALIAAVLEAQADLAETEIRSSSRTCARCRP
jgi:AcrR family transcriptional regulator